MKQTSSSVGKLPLVLIVVFTLLQLGVLALFGYTPYHDSDSYLYIAEECVRLGQPYPVKELLCEIPFLWNIGSINAVVASMALTGSVMPLLVVYSLMKGATAALFYSLAKRLLGAKIALACLVIYVLYPANYGEGTSALTELPFMFFIMLGMWVALVRNRFFLGGMVFAFANWFRPMGVVFLLAVIIFLLFPSAKPTGTRHRRIGKDGAWQIGKGGAWRLLAGYVAMVCLIGFATMHRTGLFLYQSKTGWMALAEYSTGHSPGALAVRDNNSWSVVQKDSAWKAVFMQWLAEHPGEYVGQMPRKLAETYVSDNVNMCVYVPGKTRESMYEEVSLRTLIQRFPRLSALQWFTVANLLFYYLLLLAAVASLCHFRPDTHLLPVAIIALGTLILLLVGHGEARFHQPFMPFVIMLSALALQRILPDHRYAVKEGDGGE